MLAYRKSDFEHLFGILDFSGRIYKFSVNLSFIMRIFSIVTSAEIGWLTEDHIWAPVWDFGISTSAYTNFR